MYNINLNALVFCYIGGDFFTALENDPNIRAEVKPFVRKITEAIRKVMRETPLPKSVGLQPGELSKKQRPIVKNFQLGVFKVVRCLEENAQFLIAENIRVPLIDRLIADMFSIWSAAALSDEMDIHGHINYSALVNINRMMKTLAKKYRFQNRRYSPIANKRAVQIYRECLHKLFETLVSSGVNGEKCCFIDHAQLLDQVIDNIYSKYPENSTIRIDLTNDGTDYGLINLVILGFKFVNMPNQLSDHSTDVCIPLRAFVGKDSREKIYENFKPVYAWFENLPSEYERNGVVYTLKLAYAGDGKSHAQLRGLAGTGAAQTANSYVCMLCKLSQS
jgi:hypothetical protein